MTFEDWEKIRNKPECKGCKYYRKFTTGELNKYCHYLLDTGEPRKTEPWKDGKCDKYDKGTIDISPRMAMPVVRKYFDIDDVEINPEEFVDLNEIEVTG